MLLSLAAPIILVGQTNPCNFTLSGYVKDEGTEIPLHYSNILLEDHAKGAVTDSTGFFKLENLCAGDYHLRISHIGCEPQSTYLKLRGDTIIMLTLHHHAEFLDEVVVHGSQENNTAQVSSTISSTTIEQNSSKNLSDILEQITGVSSLKSGVGISKPVIHGLYGNRVAILNNGVEQSGQQWGNDHAPEIDPFFADHLAVIKGAGALAYGGNSLGSVVLVESDKIPDDPHLHGKVNYTFQSNGYGHTLNTQLEKNSSWAAWRLSTTLKKKGDSRAPNYWLNNTGAQEANFALQVEKSFSPKWNNQLYISSFNTEIGVFRGSHIGNLTDLNSALDRDIPFFTEDQFSYGIEPPRQKVNHHLIKFESQYFLSEDQVFKFKYGGQLNDRKEFDVRRGGRSNIPSLSLKQYTNFVEFAYQQNFKHGYFLKSGLQYKFVDNSNVPGTGILPLIPNYDAQIASSFLILQKEKNQWFYEMGARYDLKLFEVATITTSLPRRIERFENTFHNYAISGGVKYKFSESLKANANLGYMLRAPEINELYSAGLHQGVSGIEEGNPDLQSERSLKGIISLDWFYRKKVFFQALAYYQHIRDYIYLQPQSEFQLTIRGAFPVFIYQQTDARLQGLDLLLSVEPSHATKLMFKYSKIDARDLSEDLVLINTPADQFSSAFTFAFKDFKNLKQSELELNAKYVLQKQDILESQDFTESPDEYFLLGLSASTQLDFSTSNLRLSIHAENLLNTTYRDYLNRLRYFADEPGIDVRINLRYAF